MNQLATLSLAFAAATDIGCKRANNEDSFGYNNDPHLYVVCDGVGGGAAGEVASSTAVRTLLNPSKRNRWPPMEGRRRRSESRLLHSIQRSKSRRPRDRREQPAVPRIWARPWCALAWTGLECVIGNVSDSRAYLIRDGVGLQITQDHSLLDEQIRNGIITPEMAEHFEPAVGDYPGHRRGRDGRSLTSLPPNFSRKIFCCSPPTALPLSAARRK